MLTKEQRLANQRASIARYNKKTKQYPVRFRFDVDADVIERLESVGNKVGYLRELIRRDIRERPTL